MKIILDWEIGKNIKRYLKTMLCLWWCINQFRMEV